MVFNIARVIKKNIPTVFIAIVQEDDIWIINSKVIKNGIVKKKFSKSFDVQEEDALPQDMSEYLERIQTDYNFAYVSLFLDSTGQGAIYGNTTSDFEKNSVDIKNVTHFDTDAKWSVYASFIDINWIKKLFSQVGIDFIYSPFMVQNFLLEKEKRKKEPILYILNHHDCVTISIFEEADLVFGAFFRTKSDEKLVNSDEIDYWDNEPEAQDTIELFGRDVLIYKYLISSLREYYSNDLYRSEFIEKIVLFDGDEVSPDLIKMVKNNLFMDVELQKVNIHEVICEMSINEAMQ
jgi:hypothetical protein